MARRPIGWRSPLHRRAAAAVAALLSVALLAGCSSPRVEPPPVTTTAPAVAAAPTYYLDCSAQTNGSGTRTSPWSTADAVAAHGAFQPGDRVLLRRGTTCTGRIVPTGSGTNGDPIVLGAYGSGALPVVNGAGTPDGTGTVQLTDLHDWVVQDLEVTNLDPAGPDSTLRAGILVLDDGAGALGRIVIRRNTVRSVTGSPAGGSADPHQYGGIAVLVRGTAPRTGALSDVRIEDNLVDHVGRIGIVAWSAAWPASPLTGVSITGNRVVEPDGDGIVLWGIDGGVIEHNLEQGGGRLPACPRCSAPPANTASAGIWPVMSTRILMRYNEVWGVGGGGGDGQGFDIDDATSDVVMEGNYAHDNDGGGVLICGARDSDVRSNVFANDGGGEVTFSCPTQRDGVRITSNTFFLPAGGPEQVVRHTSTHGTEPVLFADNVVIDGNGGGYAWAQPVTAQGNLYAGVLPPSAPADATALTDPGLAAPGTGGTGLDSVAGYRPLPGSAASTGGVTVPSPVLDYFGMTRTGQEGRGAIGASTAPPALPPTAPVVTRAGSDVVVTWTADRGTGWRLQRSVGAGPFRTISGVLTGGRFVDAGAPIGDAAYRLEQVGRDSVGAPSATVAAG